MHELQTLLKAMTAGFTHFSPRTNQIVSKIPPTGEPVERDHRTHGGTRGWSSKKTGKLIWSVVLTPKSRLLQRCCGDRRNSLHVRRTNATLAMTERRQHTDWDEGTTHRLLNLGMGPTILSWSIRRNAEFVIWRSGCHEARFSDQNTCFERQENS